MGSLFGNEEQHEPVHALHAAALSLVERAMVRVARVPARAAQFGLANGAGRDVFDHDRDFANELIDGRAGRMERLHQGVAKEQEQSERERREQEPLHPHL